MNNCRNCKHGAFGLNARGRVDRFKFAECVFPVSEIRMPASRREETRSLHFRVAVASYDAKAEVNCPTYEPK